MGRLIALLVLVCALAACGKPEPPPTPEDTVYGDQIKALDKAKGVQEQVDQQKRDLDKRLKEAEEGGQ